MGNAAHKSKGRESELATHSRLDDLRSQVVFLPGRSRSPDYRKSSTGSSSSASWASATEDTLPETLEDYISDPRDEDFTADNFMKAVLSFCSYMDGRVDTLDNSRLYEEFCSYTASHCGKVGIA